VGGTLLLPGRQNTAVAEYMRSVAEAAKNYDEELKAATDDQVIEE
jgi:hypothetical protein